MARPKGSKNVGELVDAVPPHCPKCNCTGGTYTGSRSVQDFVGEIDGRPFNQIMRRRRECEDCGQIYIVRTYHYEK